METKDVIKVNLRASLNMCLFTFKITGDLKMWHWLIEVNFYSFLKSVSLGITIL